MTREEIEELKGLAASMGLYDDKNPCKRAVILGKAIKELEQEPINKSAMMYDIYMEGVNMSGEYQGCWVRFKDIKKIVDKYTRSEET